MLVMNLGLDAVAKPVSLPPLWGHFHLSFTLTSILITRGEWHDSKQLLVPALLTPTLPHCLKQWSFPKSRVHAQLHGCNYLFALFKYLNTHMHMHTHMHIHSHTPT